jgi:hypothetical protein
METLSEKYSVHPNLQMGKGFVHSTLWFLINQGQSRKGVKPTPDSS